MCFLHAVDMDYQVLVAVFNGMIEFHLAPGSLGDHPLKAHGRDRRSYGRSTRVGSRLSPVSGSTKCGSSANVALVKVKGVNYFTKFIKVTTFNKLSFVGGCLQK